MESHFDATHPWLSRLPKAGRFMIEAALVTAVISTFISMSGLSQTNAAATSASGQNSVTTVSAIN